MKKKKNKKKNCTSYTQRRSVKEVFWTKIR